MGLLNRRSAGGTRELKIEKEITIINRLGLHARPAAKFVRIASGYRSEIWVEKEGEQINGKSIMGLMMLAAGPGCKIRVQADGNDAAQAVHEIEALLKRKFDEE